MPRLIAQFPICSHCGKQTIQLVSNAPIMVKVENDSPQLIKRGEAAAYLRFLASISPNGAVAQQIYSALGDCINISRVVDRLRKRLGPDSIPCEMRTKAGGSGRLGIYYLPEHVEVSEVSKEGADQ